MDAGTAGKESRPWAVDTWHQQPTSVLGQRQTAAGPRVAADAVRP